jgi:hypothetical protein
MRLAMPDAWGSDAGLWELIFSGAMIFVSVG